MEGKLTVYFDEPFWVGVFERCDNVKATPHRDCGADAQSDFSADCA